MPKLLTKCPDIGVGIEAHIPNGILSSCVAISELLDVRRALKILYSDGKFYAWNIEKEELERAISNLGFVIDYNELLRTILKTYLKKVVRRYSSIIVDGI